MVTGKKIILQEWIENSPWINEIHTLVLMISQQQWLDRIRNYARLFSSAKHQHASTYGNTFGCFINMVLILQVHVAAQCCPLQDSMPASFIGCNLSQGRNSRFLLLSVSSSVQLGSFKKT